MDDKEENWKAKAEFVNELIDSVRQEIFQNIPRMPTEWDGIELREYIADKFNNARYHRMDRKRKRAYNNAVLINNL